MGKDADGLGRGLRAARLAAVRAARSEAWGGGRWTMDGVFIELLLRFEQDVLPAPMLQ